MSGEVHPISKNAPRNVRNETHDERYQEDKETDSSYLRRSEGDHTEAQHASNKRDHKENERIVQHGVLLLLFC